MRRESEPASACRSVRGEPLVGSAARRSRPTLVHDRHLRDPAPLRSMQKIMKNSPDLRITDIVKAGTIRVGIGLGSAQSTIKDSATGRGHGLVVNRKASPIYVSDVAHLLNGLTRLL
jgi:hypothetical protein